MKPEAESPLINDVVEHETREVLGMVSERLSSVPGPTHVSAELDALRRKVGEPCVIAVVGQVNAGKSSFINAYLGQDLAMVGEAETTATINHFTYADGGRPDWILCHWRDGHVSREDRSFLEALQGNSLESLKRAHEIAFLEYQLDSPVLRKASIVDTPGTGAVVTEHEGRTNEYLAIAGEMHARRSLETRDVHSRADAVVYLVGAIARRADQDLLMEFKRGQGELRAMNTLAVLAKIDLDPDLMARRVQLAAKVAAQLADELNAVVPVSAAVARLLQKEAITGYRILRDLLVVVGATPPEDLELLLGSEELFCDLDLGGCAGAAETRSRLWLQSELPWSAFRAVVLEAQRAADVDSLAVSLGQIAGFDRLRQVLDEHIIARGSILRCHRLLQEARKGIRAARFGDVQRTYNGARRELGQLERLEGACSSLEGVDAEAALLLAAYLQSRRTATSELVEVYQKWVGAEDLIRGSLQRLEQHNQDFMALQSLLAGEADLRAAEADELRALFGCHGFDVQARLRGQMQSHFCMERQMYWRVRRDSAPRTSGTWYLADRAQARLGYLIAELLPVRESPEPHGYPHLSADGPCRGRSG